MNKIEQIILDKIDKAHKQAMEDKKNIKIEFDISGVHFEGTTNCLFN